jgi:HAD superfamily hydrolase (TIGR01458 family)
MAKGVLLDLGGVVYTGDAALPGAISAIDRLRATSIPLRFATNVTSRSRRALLKKLRDMGITVAEYEVFMPGIAARAYLKDHQLTPYLLVADALEEDFAGLGDKPPNAVVIGDAGEKFSYERLNTAFRLLREGAPLIALAGNRYYRDVDDKLSLDAGAFVKTLEYAADTEAIMLGKPAAGFFEAAAASMGLAPDDVVMVGDDAEFDVAAAIKAGFQGLLVKTGKYEDGAEDRVSPKPTAVVADIAEAVDWILS